jgi:hypothetical protein
MNVTTNNTVVDASLEVFRKEVSAGMGSIGVISTALHTRLVLYLCINDFIQGLAASSSLGYINHPPQFGDSLCLFQAIMFQIGDVGSAIASFYIGIYVWSNINYLSYPWIKTPGKIFERIVVVGVFGFSILLCIIGEIRAAVAGYPIYTPVGFKAWCWVNERYSLERLMIHYTWIILICFLLFVIYIHIMITLYRAGKLDSFSGGSKEKDDKKKLAKKMIGFPIVFFCAFIPLCCERVISFASEGRVKVPTTYVAFAICMFVINGFLNASLYGYTRRLFHKIADSIDDDTEATMETR